MMLSFGPLEKDRAGLDTGLLTIAKNAYPTTIGYGPMPSLATFGSNALPSGCKGLYAVKIGSTYHVFAGTATKLYKLIGGTWTDYTRTTGGNYTTAADNLWRCAAWGTLLIAVNGSDAPQVLDLAGAAVNFSALAGSPPVAKDLSVVGDFVFLQDANNPRRLVWCGTTGPNTATSWTLGTDLCDEYIAPDGGNIVSVPMLGEYGLFLQDDGVARRIVLQPGDPYAAFRFEKIEGVKGGLRGYNQVGAKGRIFYLAENGPHYLGPDGSNEAIAEQRVVKEFLDTCDPARIERALAFADPYSTRIYWAYHSPTAGNSYDRLMGYDISGDRFFFAEIEADFWAPVALPGTTLEGLNASYPSLDDMDVSLDSRQFQGGRPTIGAVTSDGKLGLLSGPSLTATLRISSVHLIQGSRALLTQVEPMGEWGAGTTVSLKVGKREYSGTSTAWVGPLNRSSRTGMFYPRVSSRLFEIEVEISGSDWVHAQGLQTTEQPDGQQ
jgi:hypothetical protein